MRNNFLYFGVDAAATQAFDNVDCSGAQTFQLTTGGFDNPIPTGVNFLANGGAKVTVTAHANHAFGSAYGSPAAGTEVDITAACTIHASNGTITVAKTGANGFTGDASTAANNDFDVTQLKPYVEGNGYVYNSKHLKGIAVAGATTTALNFQAKTGDANAIDILTVTHGSAKFKEFTKALTDVIADDNKVSGMVVVVDDMRGLKLPNDSSAIASVAGTYDS
jgi:hypothetical protein|tara:strand:+ start:3538 stop:4200 length:663 start_codon:yes stop_codon:yes gene_type:complete